MTGDKSFAPPALPTDLGDNTRAGRFAGIEARRANLADQDEVFDLAFALQSATDRRLMQVTLPEQRAVAMLCVRASIIGTHAVEFSDADASGDPVRRQAALDALLQVVRNP